MLNLLRGMWQAASGPSLGACYNVVTIHHVWRHGVCSHRIPLSTALHIIEAFKLEGALNSTALIQGYRYIAHPHMRPAVPPFPDRLASPMGIPPRPFAFRHTPREGPRV